MEAPAARLHTNLVPRDEVSSPYQAPMQRHAGATPPSSHQTRSYRSLHSPRRQFTPPAITTTPPSNGRQGRGTPTKSPASGQRSSQPAVFRLPSPYDASSSEDEDEEEEETTTDGEAEYEDEEEEEETHRVSNSARHERRGRGSPFRRDDADTLLRELEKRRREEVKLAMRANVQNYEADVRSLAEALEAAVLSPSAHDEQQAHQITEFMAAESRLRAQAVQREMERRLREEEERTREDNRRLAEFTRRKQALDAIKKQKEDEERRRAEAEAEAKRLAQERAAQAEAAAKQREEQAAQQAAAAAAAKEAESKAAADRQAQAQAAAAAAAAKSSGTSGEAVYRQSMDLLKEIQAKTEAPGAVDPAVRKQVMLKSHLNIQQISADREQVINKINILAQLIQQSPQNEASRLFCLDMIAQKIVQQGDSQVHVAQISAFPIADVAVALCSLVPEMTRILIARFHEKCCYTVPYYVPKRAGMTDQDHLLALGYQRKRNTPSGLELEESFMERMAGFIALYAAITQANPFQGAPHPHGIEHGWSWMARVLNAEPRRITATLVTKFLLVAGHALVRQYNRQFLKMLLLLKTHTLPAMASSPRVHTPSVTRLQLFIQEAEETNMRNLTTPEGRNY